MKADLHIHSIYSDSSRSPEEIVALAKKRKVGLLSICDHATIDAYSVLPEICRDNGMEYVMGVELEVLWEGEGLHMLAYNFDKDKIPLAWAVHDFTDPAIGKNYMYFPIRKVQ